MLLGMVPALIVGAVILAGLIALGVNIEAIAVAVTPFASEWPEPWYTVVHVVAGLAFLVVAILLVVYTFTAGTLIVGDPFYQRIWRHTEGRFGTVPDEGASGFWRELGRGISSGLRMLVPAVLIGVMLLAAPEYDVADRMLAANRTLFREARCPLRCRISQAGYRRQNDI